MERQARLRRAEDHIFSTGLPDSGTRLGLANMRFGLAKIHEVQERLGHDPDATFVSAPDVTVTRNTNRWRSGFGYGGTITWGEGDRELVILDLKPNACGMILGGLDRRPDPREVLERVQALGAAETEIRGIQVDWDFGESNHFIDVFRVEPAKPVDRHADGDLPRFAFLMHFAGDELRGENPFGPGLYWDRSAALRERMEVVETSFGPLRILTGEAALAYVEHYREVEAFVRERRRYAAERIFGDFLPMNNDTHQGLVGLNRMVLGCYTFDTPGHVYALGLRPDLPAYLVRGRPNLSADVLDRLGMKVRARELGLLERVTGSNILPHGGGYVFPDIRDVDRVHELNGDRYFEVAMSTGRGREILSQVRHLPFEYRGRKVLLRTLELGMADLVARLEPEYVLKV